MSRSCSSRRLSWQVHGLSTVLLVTALARSAPCQTISSDFDEDTDGWTASNTIAFQQQPAGGNPGGYLFVDNNEIEIAYVFAPPRFRGDLRCFDGGTLSFDGNMVGVGGGDWGPNIFDYGNVTVSGGGGAAQLDLVPGTHTSSGGGNPPTNTWTTFSTTLDAAAWGVDHTTWQGILSDVTGIAMSVEALFGNEQQGIDNFRLEAPSVGLLDNGSFEADGGGGAPAAWKAKNLDGGSEGRVCDTAQGGECSVAMAAGGRANKLIQKVSTSGPAGDRFRLCLSEKASGVSGTTGTYSATVRLVYTDNTSKRFKLRLPEGTRGWTSHVMDLEAAKNYKRVEVKVIFSKPAGAAWIDEVNVLLNPP